MDLSVVSLVDLCGHHVAARAPSQERAAPRSATAADWQLPDLATPHPFL